MNTSQLINKSNLSYLQKGIIHRKEQCNGGAFVNFLAVKCSAETDLSQLRNAADKVVERHEVLSSLSSKSSGCESFTTHKVDEQSVQQKLKQLIQEINNKNQNSYSEIGLECHWIIDSSEGCVFLLAAPAVICDLSSLKLIALEILFPAQNSQHENKLSYVNLLGWLDEALYSEESEEGRQFWQAMNLQQVGQFSLAGRKIVESNAAFTSDYVEIEFPTALVQKCSGIDDEHLQSLLLSAWFVTLLKRSGESQIAVNLSSAGRIFDELKNVIGPLDKPVPVKFVDLGQMKLADVVEFISQATIQSLEWRDCFNWESIGNGHEQGFNSLPFGFECQFACSQDALKNIIYMSSCDDAFEAKLQLMIDHDGVLKGGIQFDNRVYNASAIDSLALQWVHVLQILIENPLESLDRLSLLTESDKQKMQHVWCNKTEQEQLAVEPIFTMVERVAANSGQRVALQTETSQLTYEQLNQQANQLANYLKEFGLKSNERIGICLEFGASTILSMLAIHKLGAGFVVMDAEWPLARLTQVIESANVSAIITEQLLLNTVADTDTDAMLISIDRDWADIETMRSENLALKVAPTDTAYQIYTSGSTGVPKGVVISHRALFYYVQGVLPKIDVPTGSQWLALSSAAADLGYTATFGALASGGTLRLLPTHYSLDAQAMMNSLRENPVDVLKIVPSHLSALMSSAHPEHLLPKKCLVLGGEAMPHLLQKKVRALAPNLKILNHYGPSEATIGALCNHIDEQEGLYNAISIGRPMKHRVAYVLDSQGRMAGVGVTGEIYLGAEGLADGYYANDELSKAQFVNNPFGQGRLYKTGDLGRIRDDGKFEFIGRADHQVKRRGHRIELGEIEQVLLRHSEVNQVAVMFEDGDLLAYIASTIDKSELQAFCAHVLPEVMRPSHFFVMEQLPMTANGKIDRKSLAKLDISDFDSSTDYVAPRDEVEQSLTNIWLALLKTKKLGIHDNFFQVGGDSIIVIQVVARAREYGIRLTPMQVFENPTVAELACVVEVEDICEISQEPVTGSCSLAPRQTRFIELYQQDSQAYHRVRVLKVNGTLDCEVLKNTIAAIVNHHDSLRITTSGSKNTWEQKFNALDCFSKDDLVDIHYFDTEVEDELQSLFSELLKSHCWADLAKGPLFKIVYCYGAQGITGQLALLAHPLIIDGVSWRFVQEDFINVYEQLINEQPPRLPAKTHSYKEWVETLENVVTQCGESELLYWQKVSAKADIKICDVKNIEGSEQKHLRIQLPEEATEKLLYHCNSAFNTQVSDLLLSAVLLTFNTVMGQQKLSFDMEWHGRDRDFHNLDLSRTVGWFAALFLNVIDMPKLNDVASVVKAVKENMRSVASKGSTYGVLRYMHNDGDVRQSLVPVEEPQLFFTYLGHFDHHLAQDGLFSAGQQMGSTGNILHRWSHAVEIHNSVVENCLKVDWVFRNTCFDESVMQKLMDTYLLHLNSVIDYCSSHAGSYTPSDFPLAKLEQANLDSILEQQLLPDEDKSSICDIYRITKMQLGMLSRSLIEPNAGVYIIQHAIEIKGKFDESAFKSAWLEVVQRHTVLRTQFIDVESDSPLQIVRRQVQLPWQSYDWKHLGGQQQQQNFEQLLKDTCLVDYEYGKAPLMRLSFVHLSDNRFRFIWDNHHILADGWSSGVIFHEVLALYKERLTGVRASLQKPVDYVNYVAWLEQRDTQASNEYWKEYLKEASPTSAPLKDREDRNAQYVTGQLNCYFDEQLTNQLVELAQKNKVTLNILMQGAWAVLLSAYSNSKGIVFGATVSGRPPQLENVENMVGLFLNSLPIRTSINAEQSLGNLLQELQSNYIASEGHSYMPLVDIQRISGNTDVQGLFETLIVFENQPKNENLTKNQAFTIESLPASSFNHYPLSLIFVPGQRLGLALKYNAALYDESTIERIQKHFKQVLISLANADVDGPIQQISYLTDNEIQHLAKWQCFEDVAPINPKAIGKLFEQKAHQHPERLALVTETQQYTYCELNKFANQLANYLEQFGVEKGDIIGICVEQGHFSVMSMLAILKLGAAFTVMDGDWPLLRLTQVVQSSNAKVIITEQVLLNHVSDTDTDAMIVSMDRDLEDIQILESDNLEVNIKPEQAAYLIYTSGSTGTPKGVVVSHRALHYYVEGMLPRINVHEASSWLALATSAADLGYTSLFGALISGGTLRQLPTEFNLNAEAMATSLAQRPVDVLKIVPSHLSALLTVKNAQRLLPKQCLITGGDVLTPSLIERVRELAPGLKIVNHYGPSETTIGALTCEVTPEEASRDIIAIGRPMAHREVYILDAQLRINDVGILGEIYIGGEGMAVGYHNLPEMTAERFIKHPYKPDARLYRTGDLGRFREDGQVEFFGRADHQVKRRGYRIELGEIEQVILRHEAVTQAAVILKSDQLLAFVVSSVDENELERHAQAYLSDVMQPTHWILMDALPQTGNGKIDRRGLSKIEPTSNKQSSEFIPPQTPVQIELTNIWQQLLKVERVSIDDNFFRLGGDSIIVIQLVAKAREKGIKINPTQVFEHQTIETLSEVAEVVGELNAIQETVVGDSLMTPIQHRFFDVVTTEPHHYNQSYLFNLNEVLDLAVLQQTMAHLIEHHDALRASYKQVDGQWQQSFSPFDKLCGQHAVIRVDWHESQDFVFDTTVAQIQSGFELEAGGLFKLVWFDNAHHGRLLFTCHHLLVDGVSWRILLEDFETAYRALQQGQLVNLTSKTTAYKDWAQRLNDKVNAGLWLHELDYWKSLKYVNYTCLPTKQVGPCLESSSTLHIAYLPESESKALLSGVHHSYNTEINDLLLSALYMALEQQFSMGQMIVELEGHGREDLFEDIDLSRTVGWFTSTFPVHLTANRSRCIDTVLKSVKESLRNVPNKGIGYGLLRYLAKNEVQQQFNQMPKTEVRLNYLGRFDQNNSEGLLSERVIQGVKHNHSGNQKRQYVLNINAMVSNGQLGIGIEYSKEQLDEAVVASFAEALVAKLSAIVNHCQTPGVGGLTPSDLPDAGMDQQQLDKFIIELADILELV